ncbi:MAG: hypothetical protein RLZZ367_714 [Bacteroidota bacterium]|jgi:hypothetical protein
MKIDNYKPDPQNGRRYLEIFKKMVREKREWEKSLKNVDVKELMKKSVPIEKLV